jgi:predicted amidohydrolase
VLGDVEANLETHLSLIAEARNDRADLLLFPELSLTGYGLRDLVPAVARKADGSDHILKPLVKASHDLDLVVSFVESDARHRYFVSAAYMSKGEILHVHRKVYLPTYGLFEEGRFLAWGDRVAAFDTRFGRVGMLICEDFWHASPPYLLWLDGADLFLFLSASPSRGLTQADRLVSVAWVELINQAYASLFTSYVLHTNRVGFEDGLMLGGRATVYDAEGEMVAHGPYHEPALTFADLDTASLARTRSRLPLLRDERTSLVLRELERLAGPGARSGFLRVDHQGGSP